MIKRFTLLFLIGFLIVIIGFRGGRMLQTEQNVKSIKDITELQWQLLSQKKIFFGHQSVGVDILNGIKDLMEENPDIKLNLVETSDPDDFKAGVFAHARVGQNVNPGSKIRDFEKMVDSGLGNKVDFAFLKFCFVDIHSGTDLPSIFDDYKHSMADLSRKYPETTFLHLTTPLTLTPSGVKGVIKNFKDFIKKMVGKTNMYDNGLKYRFNKMMRQEYDEGNYLFDLAMHESTTTDGNLVSYEKGKNKYYTLLPEYTDDGGHLNRAGRRKVAEQLLLFVINNITK